VVRDKIKHFASLAVGTNQKSTASYFTKNAAATEQDDEENYPNPPFKIIILDEADTVTKDAQAALRRVIEAHSRITRFILICNYVTRIIEPLASRCAKFRFQPLPAASMKNRLMLIADSEGCSEDEKELVDEILEHADGDMRRAVTTLQSVHSLAVGGGRVDKESIAEIAGLPPATVVDTLWQAFSSTSFDGMQKAVEDVCANGYSALLLLAALLPKVMTEASWTELSKAEVAIRIAEAEKNMIEGADEYLQLMTVCSLAYTAFKKK
jgi:replication factor C subunit 2/4